MRFSGHETFICKQFWLKKGYDYLLKGNRFNDDDAVIELGVGKNMVAAIGHWMKAFGLCNEKWELTEIAHYIFNDTGRDKYFESIGTAWLFHYQLIKEDYSSIYNLFFNDFRRGRHEFSIKHLHDYLKIKSEKDNSYNENTIKTDISVFIRMYQLPNIEEGKSDPEDVYSSIFNDLQLLPKIKIEKFDGKGFTDNYRITNEKRDNLPFEIVLFSILDRYNDSQSINLKELEIGHDSPCVVFALNKDGLTQKIEQIASKYRQAVFSNTAGVQELQFKSPINKWDVLSDYYARN